jgi:hypothetical protein
MKCAVEIGLGVMIPSFINIGLDIQMLIGGFTEIQPAYFSKEAVCVYPSVYPSYYLWLLK